MLFFFLFKTNSRHDWVWMSWLFYVTRIKRKSKGSLSSKSQPPHFVLDGKRRRLLPLVGSSFLTDENTLPETVQNFFFVFFSSGFISKSHFGNILSHGEGVGCYAGEIRRQRQPIYSIKTSNCFVFFFLSKNAQCIANKFAHLKLILRFWKLLLWQKL